MLGGRRRSSDNRGGGEALTAIFFVVGIILIFLSPIIAQLIQLAISRNREFLADASGAKLTGYPPGLASALAKLNQDHEPLEAANKATAHLYIVNPLHDRQDAVGWFSGLFATHPPMGERIKRLQSM
jgi:heat shock protein HtpX